MYERMLDKQTEPSFEDLIRYSGAAGPLWIALEEYLTAQFGASKLIRFPYGNSYGWGVKYSRRSKHICDVYAENGAFTVQFQVSSAAVEAIYDTLDDCAKDVWANKYPCASGGWVNFRILGGAELESAKKMLEARMKPRRK